MHPLILLINLLVLFKLSLEDLKSTLVNLRDVALLYLSSVFLLTGNSIYLFFVLPLYLISYISEKENVEVALFNSFLIVGNIIVILSDVVMPIKILNILLLVLLFMYYKISDLYKIIGFVDVVILISLINILFKTYLITKSPLFIISLLTLGLIGGIVALVISYFRMKQVISKSTNIKLITKKDKLFVIFYILILSMSLANIFLAPLEVVIIINLLIITLAVLVFFKLLGNLEEIRINKKANLLKDSDFYAIEINYKGKNILENPKILEDLKKKKEDVELVFSLKHIPFIPFLTSLFLPYLIYLSLNMLKFSPNFF